MQFSLLQSGVIGVFTGFTRTLSRWICEVIDMVSIFAEDQGGNSYLVAGCGIKEDPSQFNDFSGVFSDKHPMLIAGCGDVDHYITVETRFLPLVVCHSRLAKLKYEVSTGENLKLPAGSHVLQTKFSVR